MDKAYMRAVFEKAISKYGESAQIIKAIEELSELQKSLCKIFFYSDNLSNIIEEIVDVEIMIEQLKMIFEIDEETIETGKIKKVERLENRLLGKTIYDQIDEYENQSEEVFEDNDYGCEGSI